MATSGTATWNPDYGEIVEMAYTRASGGQSPRGGFDLRAARFALNELFSEWSNRGINLWTIEQGTLSLSDGTATYSLPADTVDLIEHVIRSGSGTSQSDIKITRISVTTYSDIPNKTTEGQPTQIYVQRTTSPQVTVWPVPDTSYTLVYWRLRRIEDTGNQVDYTLDMPHRFLPALIAGLAHRIAMNNASFTDRVQYLEQQYEKQFELAAGEDRERANLLVQPWNYG